MEVVLREADVAGECVERQVLIQGHLNVHQRGDDQLRKLLGDCRAKRIADLAGPGPARSAR